jgi:hypothetical protein
MYMRAMDYFIATAPAARMDLFSSSRINDFTTATGGKFMGRTLSSEGNFEFTKAGHGVRHW